MQNKYDSVVTAIYHMKQEQSETFYTKHTTNVPVFKNSPICSSGSDSIDPQVSDCLHMHLKQVHFNQMLMQYLTCIKSKLQNYLTVHQWVYRVS